MDDAYYKAQAMAKCVKEAKDDPLFFSMLTEAFYEGTKLPPPPKEPNNE